MLRIYAINVQIELCTPTDVSVYIYAWMCAHVGAALARKSLLEFDVLLCALLMMLMMAEYGECCKCAASSPHHIVNVV